MLSLDNSDFGVSLRRDFPDGNSQFSCFSVEVRGGKI
jgi:hypothetical protein